MDEVADIVAGRLTAAELAHNFADAHPPLTSAQAVVAAERCYFCHDAPCIEACPTGIDVPGFIGRIATGNLRGAAQTILDANILGGSCARVCPTEILCERACVRTAQEGQPIRIGALQRHATDWLMERGIHPHSRAASTGRRVAIVGAGPAGLACAHGLARHGHDVTIFEAADKPGGLNEYGIAAYKLTEDFAQREIDFVLAIGGIEIVTDEALGRDFTLPDLLRDFDAVFLAIGLAGVRALGLNGPELRGVHAAVDFIASLRQSDKSAMQVGRRVVVIGGGNTAIDAATQARLLGAQDVALVYRGAPARMSATPNEQAWAQTHGVRILHDATPLRLHAAGGAVTAVEFTRQDSTRFTLPADMVLTAIGQTLLGDPLDDALALANGRIAIDSEGRTSLPRVWAGGDCVAGADLTVTAVADGKAAAASIHRLLAG